MVCLKRKINLSVIEVGLFWLRLPRVPEVLKWPELNELALRDYSCYNNRLIKKTHCTYWKWYLIRFEQLWKDPNICMWIKLSMNKMFSQKFLRNVLLFYREINISLRDFKAMTIFSMYSRNSLHLRWDISIPKETNC